jgi:hypothetical protein
MKLSWGTQVFLECDPEVMGVSQIAVVIPKPQVTLNRNRKGGVRPAITIAEQVDEILKDWYASKGLEVPPDEVGIGAKMAAADEAAEAVVEAARAVAEEETPSVVPSYGTPEFWAYHRAKKVAENKRRAEAGLPSVEEEKKQKEAEKAEKAKAREAKKAAKNRVDSTQT